MFPIPAKERMNARIRDVAAEKTELSLLFWLYFTGFSENSV